MEPAALNLSDASLRFVALVYGVKYGGERKDCEGKEGEADCLFLSSYTLFVNDAVAAVLVMAILGRTVFIFGEAWTLASN